MFYIISYCHVFILYASIDQSKHIRQTCSYYLQHINDNTMLNNLLDIIAPEICIECGQEGSIWCEWCRLQHDPLPSRCFICHAQTENYVVCQKCRQKTGLRATYVFGEYKDINKQLITALKFDCKRHVAASIASSMAETLPYFNAPPTLMHVPSSPSRVRQRGFDHTLVIAKELAKQSKFPRADILARTNDIRQVGATRKQRSKQIEGAFRLKRIIKEVPKHVILIDDVVTTGATLSEAARVLKCAGVKRVDAITFAYSK